MSSTVTVGETIARVAAGQWDAADQVWVLDSERRLRGVVSIDALLRADPQARIGDIGNPAPVAVSPDTREEHLALHAIGQRQSAVPITDPRGQFLGVVLAGALLQILRDEHVEDLHRLVGIQPEPRGRYTSADEPPARSAWHRLPWLLVGLVGTAIATWTMSHFESALAHHVALGFFVPGIVYLADAIGTQSETLAVRRLSHSHLPLTTLVLRELTTGTLVGGTLAVGAFAGVWLGFSQPWLALAVALAVLSSGILATTIGVSLPWLLNRLGRDPALGSGPLATILQDCLSILIYFTIAAHLVP